jgi:predicted DNA-binding transcriptional regulator AlpA
MTKDNTYKPNRILRWPQVQDKVGLSKSYCYQLQQRGIFPKCVKIIEGGRGSGYWEHEIDDWLHKRHKATRG